MRIGKGDTNMATMSLKDAKKELQPYAMTVNKTDAGEYRVNFLGGSEESAYYTPDVDDAVMTGKDMSVRATLAYERLVK